LKRVISLDMQNVRIEKLKHRLNKLVEEFGISDPRTYKQSLKLDIEIVKFQKSVKDKIE